MSSNAAFSLFRRALKRAEYTPDRVDEGTTEGIDWCVGYAFLPCVARNACVAAIKGGTSQVAQAVARATGAPVVFAFSGAQVTAWQWTPGGARELEVFPEAEFVESSRVRELIDPRTIHRAKTLGRFDGSYQLDFVDMGFMPHLEQVQGEDLRRLLERIVAELRTPEDTLNDVEGHQVLTMAFWVLAARMLRDHGVRGFVELEAKGKQVLEAIGRHYGANPPILARKAPWSSRIDAAAQVAWDSGLRLDKVGPEAIGYVYETSLIANQLRKDLGTHSTPPFLVEYVIGRLRAAIQAIPRERRVIVEPACGHGAFLVAGLQMLAEDLPESVDRHTWLRDRIRGLEIDGAAKEMARLSLTLADVPNPDGWNLRETDMFADGVLEALARDGTVLLCNPPFEDFTDENREVLRDQKEQPLLGNKAAEMLRRVLPALAPDAVVGLVVPRTFLHSAGERSVRKAMLGAFRLIEICLLPDKIFRLANHECAVILARGAPGGTTRDTPVTFRRVREAGREVFKTTAVVSSEESVPGAVFLDDEACVLVVPELARLWKTRDWPRLGQIATVQQGLTYFGRLRKAGYDTVRAQAFEGSAPGVVGPGESKALRIVDEPLYNHMDIQKANIRDKRGGLPKGRPQVVVNYHPRSVGPLRVAALIEPRGATIPSSWLAVRPRSDAVGVELLWALCNSYMANAFVYAHSDKRNIMKGTLSELPIPVLTPAFCDEVTRQVQALFAAAQTPDADEAHLGELMARIDALVLGAYGLFAPAEQRLLDLFKNDPRPGLPSPPLKHPRLPQYLGHEGLAPPLPPPSSAFLATTSLVDIDAEIEDGYWELAELRRHGLSTDPRIHERERFVRATLDALGHRSAELGIPGYRREP